MSRFEYKVVPAPKKGQRAKGVRGPEGKFANALQNLMNQQGAEGWEYQRTDTLPCEERSGLRGKTTVFQNMLVFRRALEDGAVARIIATVDDIQEPDRAEPPLRREDTEVVAESVAEIAEETDHDETNHVFAESESTEKSDPPVVSTAT